MSLVLLILGILATAAGIVTIGFGIPVNEFNLGNAMIVAGTTATAAGLILVGLAAAVEQLTQIAKALRPRAGGRPQPVEQNVAAAIRPPTPQFPVQPVVPMQAPVAPPIQAPVPPPGQIKPPPSPARGPFAKPRVEERAEEPPASAPEPQFSAIERLRASLVRTDRKGAAGADESEAEPSSAQAPPSQPLPPARPAPPVNAEAGANDAAPPSAAPATDAPKKPPLDFLFRARSRAPQSDPFDEMWPKRGPGREPAEDAASTAAPAAAPSERPARAEMPVEGGSDDGRPAAILKSGVVDGMAYTLYADGSIEAQLPHGTVRFGSIAELRSHIENSS